MRSFHAYPRHSAKSDWNARTSSFHMSCFDISMARPRSLMLCIQSWEVVSRPLWLQSTCGILGVSQPCKRGKLLMSAEATDQCNADEIDGCMEALEASHLPPSQKGRQYRIHASHCMWSNHMYDCDAPLQSRTKVASKSPRQRKPHWS